MQFQAYKAAAAPVQQEKTPQTNKIQKKTMLNLQAKKPKKQPKKMLITLLKNPKTIKKQWNLQKKKINSHKKT